MTNKGRISNTRKKKRSKKGSKSSQYVIGIMLIFFFEIMDVYPEAKAKTIILRIIKKMEVKNTKISDNFESIYPFIKSKYLIWKQEKSKWDRELAISLSKDISEFNKDKLESNTKCSKKSIKSSSKKQDGGFYFKSLESKGEKPITGQDITNLLDEIQGFFYNAKYTEEGQWLREPDVLLSLFRGDTDAFKFHLNYVVLPKYYQLFPPFLKWGAIKEAIANKKYEDYPDYLLAYLSYQKLKNAWEVEQGIAKPKNFDASPFASFANASDRLMTGIAQYRRKILQPGSMKMVMGMPGGTFIG
jgi:hypothetical protein